MSPASNDRTNGAQRSRETFVEHEKEVWLSKGPLFDAIRVSIAIPMVFTPFEMGGQRLVDGGVINPVPIAPTLRDRTDLTIAVNVNGLAVNIGSFMVADAAPRDCSGDAQEVAGYRERIGAFISELAGRLRSPAEETLDMFGIMTLSLDTMQNTIARLKLAAYKPDLTIIISKEVANMFEFYRARELIELGRECTRQMLESRRPAGESRAPPPMKK